MDTPSTDQIWEWLDGVPDPEIPVISLVDLGIIRDVVWAKENGVDMLNVTVTPTYSGCPATTQINQDILEGLAKHGLTNVTLHRQLSPAWTTDWLSDKGKASLEKFGIAPPSPKGTPDRCPNCGSANVTRTSQFGSTPCKALWRCSDCLEPFDYFKCI